MSTILNLSPLYYNQNQTTENNNVKEHVKHFCSRRWTLITLCLRAAEQFYSDKSIIKFFSNFEKTLDILKNLIILHISTSFTI